MQKTSGWVYGSDSRRVRNSALDCFCFFRKLSNKVIIQGVGRKAMGNPEVLSGRTTEEAQFYKVMKSICQINARIPLCGTALGAFPRKVGVR